MHAAAFRREQRAVATRMATALAVSGIAIGPALCFGPEAPLRERLAIMAVVTPATLAWLVAAIGNVARLRFVSPDDIAGSGDHEASARTRHAAAILQNTLEQVVLAISVQLLVTIVVERGIAVLIVLGTLFCIGRALFWRGYAGGAAARATGFALSFYPSVLALVVVSITAVVRV